MPFDLGFLSDVGRRRTENEDAVDLLELSGGTLCTVADGMGGHQAGEVASRLAIETIRETLRREPPPADPAAAAQALAGAIQAANQAVFRESAADETRRGMGTTVVCALLGDASALLANVGDSPAFLVRDREVHRLTKDHSWVAEELSRGAISPDEAAIHPYRHVLTRSLGVAEELEVEVYPPLELQSGDVLVLCTDGLSEHLQPADLPTVVHGVSADAAARELVALANQRGGSDNITVVVAHYQEPAASNQ